MFSFFSLESITDACLIRLNSHCTDIYARFAFALLRAEITNILSKNKDYRTFIGEWIEY